MFNDSSIYPKIAQGITTDVSGNCGVSCAPISIEYFEHLKKYMSGLGAGINPPENWKDFTTFENYLNEINKLKLGPNVAFYVGQGTIRIAVMGFENRRATNEEMRKMKDLVREAMESGAVGMSTGLISPRCIHPEG
jgi:N-acyl-D-aspartate/D-glutamate deacylase